MFLLLAVMGHCINVLTDAGDTFFVVDGSIAPRVLVTVMAFDCCISPCWPVQWPTTVAVGNVSQSATILFRMQFSWCPIHLECQLFSCSVVAGSVQGINIIVIQG